MKLNSEHNTVSKIGSHFKSYVSIYIVVLVVVIVMIFMHVYILRQYVYPRVDRLVGDIRWLTLKDSSIDRKQWADITNDTCVWGGYSPNVVYRLNVSSFIVESYGIIHIVPVGDPGIPYTLTEYRNSVSHVKDFQVKTLLPSGALFKVGRINSVDHITHSKIKIFADIISPDSHKTEVCIDWISKEDGFSCGYTVYKPRDEIVSPAITRNK